MLGDLGHRRIDRFSTELCIHRTAERQWKRLSVERRLPQLELA